MENFNVYSDIKARTEGEIYIGVVGPVRTGKSTFIKRFMEQMVLPEMEDGHAKERARDELPQSAAGKTIMTTEPKFIPKEAAEIPLGDGVEAKIRLIDCVGFMVDGAAGHIENDVERLVKTPWFDYEIPFTQAAELGTRKVITDHSTIGLVITADGSFGEIKRPSYMEAEEKTVRELKNLGKPFLILLNSMRPYSDETKALAAQMEEKYGVQVMPVNCEQLKREDIRRIMETVLTEFPVAEVDFFIPKWLEILPQDHWLKIHVVQAVKELLKKISRMKDIGGELPVPSDGPIRRMKITGMKMADGSVSVDIEVDDSCYYQILSDYTGVEIGGEYQLMQTLRRLAAMEREYEKVGDALSQVRLKGYGVVTPDRSEIVLDEPQLIHHGNKSHIETEIAPIVGSEQQAEDLIEYIKANAKESEDGLWNTNIFGKSVEQIVGDGIQAKISQMTEDCQIKLQDTLQKIINDSNGGMICIII